MYAVNESLPDSETSAERRVQISYVAPLRSGAGVDTRTVRTDVRSPSRRLMRRDVEMSSIGSITAGNRLCWSADWTARRRTCKND